MHDLNNYKHVDKASGSELIREENLQLDLMRNIPSQIEKFFEIQHFDFDNSNTFLNSPDPTNMSCSDTSSQNNYGTALMNGLEVYENGQGAAVLSPTTTSPEKEGLEP